MEMADTSAHFEKSKEKRGSDVENPFIFPERLAYASVYFTFAVW